MARAEGASIAFGDLMRRRHSLSIPGAAGAAVFAVASFALLWPMARLDFDRHHDGYMVAQAVAVHQGALVHSGAFAQYGPVTPWLQSLALFLPVGPGLALRTANTAFIAVTAFLLADMGRRRPRDWPVTRAVGWWTAIAWVVLADVWIGVPMLPWSSTLAAMLSVGTLYLLTRAFRSAEDGSTRAASIEALAGGVLLGLIPFTRINVGLSAMAVGLVVAALTVFVEQGVKRRLAKVFVLGTALSVGMVVTILALTGSLADFYYQSIEWPLVWGRTAIDTWQTQGFLTRILAKQALPVMLACAALYLHLRARTEQRRWAVTKSAAAMFTVLAGVIISIWENIRVDAVAPGQAWWSTFLFSANAEYLYFFMVLAVVASGITGVVFMVRLFSGAKSVGRLTPWLLLAGLTISGLTQIVPTWDTQHVWWGIPIGLLFLFSLVQLASGVNRISGNPLMLPLLLAAVMAFFSSSVYRNVQRVEGQPGTVIEGMLVSRAKFDAVSQDSDFLREHLPGSGLIVYLVGDGDLSVLDGHYRSADSYFVDWGGSPRVETRLGNGTPIVVQTSFYGNPVPKSAFGESIVIPTRSVEQRIADADTVTKLARSIKYKVVAKNERLAILMPAAVSAPP